MSEVAGDKPSPGHWSTACGSKLCALVVLTSLCVLTMATSLCMIAYMYGECNELKRMQVEQQYLIESLRADIGRLSDGRVTMDGIRMQMPKPSRDTTSYEQHRTATRVKRGDIKSPKDMKKRKRGKRKKNKNARRYRNLPVAEKRTCRWCRHMLNKLKKIISKKPDSSSTLSRMLFPQAQQEYTASLPSIHMRGLKSSPTILGPGERFKWTRPDVNHYFRYFDYDEKECWVRVKVTGQYLIYNQVAIAGSDDTLNGSKSTAYSGYSTLRIPDTNASTRSDRRGTIMSSVVTQHHRGLKYAGTYPIDTLSHMGVSFVYKDEKIIVMTDKASHWRDRFKDDYELNYFGLIKIA